MYLFNLDLPLLDCILDAFSFFYCIARRPNVPQPQPGCLCEPQFDLHPTLGAFQALLSPCEAVKGWAGRLSGQLYVLFMKDAVHPLKQQKLQLQSGMTLGLLVRA